MSNKIKGVIDLNYDGATYPMMLDFNALAEFEEMADVPSALEFIGKVENLQNARMTRMLFWCGLRQFTPDMPIELAGKILSANIARLGDVLTSAFPEVDASAEGNAPTRAKTARGRK